MPAPASSFLHNIDPLPVCLIHPGQHGPVLQRWSSWRCGSFCCLRGLKDHAQLLGVRQREESAHPRCARVQYHRRNPKNPAPQGGIPPNGRCLRGRDLECREHSAPPRPEVVVTLVQTHGLPRMRRIENADAMPRLSGRTNATGIQRTRRRFRQGCNSRQRWAQKGQLGSKKTTTDGPFAGPVRTPGRCQALVHAC